MIMIIDNHFVLFNRLLRKRVPICLIKILVDWYNECFRCVTWYDCISKMFHVSQGVKQGGVLSPILFSIYVDDALSKLNDILV